MLLEKIKLQNNLPNWQLPTRKAEPWRYSSIPNFFTNNKFCLNPNINSNEAETAAKMAVCKNSLAQANILDPILIFWGMNTALPKIPGMKLHYQHREPSHFLAHSPFVDLNQNLAEDGLFIEIEQPIHQPIFFIYGVTNVKSTDEEHLPCTQPYLQITLQKNTKATLVEWVTGTHFSNALFDFKLAENSHLQHYVTSDFQNHFNSKPCHIGNISVSCAKHADYHHLSLWQNINANKTPNTQMQIRRDAHIKLTGEQSHVYFGGIATLNGESHLENVSLIEHLAENTSTDEEFRNIITDNAINSFQGKIIVHPDAQKTEGYQMSRCLMLSDTCRANHKPELEIYADDVKCSHGSTIGAPDLEQLFYLQSRGFCKKDALNLICQGFFIEMLEKIKSPELKQFFTTQIFPGLKINDDD